jgi:hypothetical protein
VTWKWFPANVVSFVREHARDDLERVLEDLRAIRKRVPRDAGLVVLDVVRPAPEADVEAAVRDHIERRRHLAEHCRVTEGRTEHHVPDAQALGLGEQRGGQGPAFERGSVGEVRPIEVVVEPERVEAESSVLRARSSMSS